MTLYYLRFTSSEGVDTARVIDDSRAINIIPQLLAGTSDESIWIVPGTLD
jgi:hypothetical protein